MLVQLIFIAAFQLHVQATPDKAKKEECEKKPVSLMVNSTEENNDEAKANEDNEEASVPRTYPEYCYTKENKKSKFRIRSFFSLIGVMDFL